MSDAKDLLNPRWVNNRKVDSPTGFMSGFYSSHEQLLLRLMMRAIDHAELAHEINNACASIAANLTYVGLQSRSLGQSEALDKEVVRETLEEFSDVSQEGLDAIQRVTKSLGKPKTANDNRIIEIEADKLIQRIVSCVNDYMPGHDIHADVAGIKILAVYRMLVSSILQLLLAGIDSRKRSAAPEKKRIDITLSRVDDTHCVADLCPHLPASECSNLRKEVARQSNHATNSNFQIKFVDANDESVVRFFLKSVNG